MIKGLHEHIYAFGSVMGRAGLRLLLWLPAWERPIVQVFKEFEYMWQRFSCSQTHFCSTLSVLSCREEPGYWLFKARWGSLTFRVRVFDMGSSVCCAGVALCGPQVVLWFLWPRGETSHSGHGLCTVPRNGILHHLTLRKKTRRSSWQRGRARDIQASLMLS